MMLPTPASAIASVSSMRLMCALDFEYTDWQDWQVKSVPREKRKKPGPMDINQLQLCTRVLVGTCQHLEHKRGDGEWAPITGQDGSYLAELLLAKGYEVHGLIRRASTFNTGRIDHVYTDPHTKGAHLFLHYGDLADSGHEKCEHQRLHTMPP